MDRAGDLSYHLNSLNMMNSRILRDALDTTIDRATALAKELERLDQKWYPPTGPKRLLELVISANKRLIRDVLSLRPEVSNLSEREVELQLRGKAKLLAFIHNLVQFLDGAGVEECPGSFVFPLRQILKDYLTDFDFILRSTRLYNYRVTPVGQITRDLFQECGYTDLLNNFPTHFFVVECPVAEKNNILMHCIFAHEVSHRIYDVNRMAISLEPLANSKLNQHDLHNLINYYATSPTEPGPGEEGQTVEDVLQRWRIEYYVRYSIQSIVSKWVDELASDALALCFLGPAYLFAYVHFCTPFAAMDEAMDSHPPDRMRIRFACDMLINHDYGLRYSNVLDPQTKSYVDELIAIAARENARPLPSRFHKLAVEAIEQIFDEIISAAKQIVKKQAYTSISFSRDTPLLCKDCLSLGIPPYEMVLDWNPPGKRRKARTAAILNAGWIFTLNRIDEYAKLLYTDDSSFVRSRIRGLISKAMEYNELRYGWGRKK